MEKKPEYSNGVYKELIYDGMKKYLTAFPGARDAYQVALSLQNAGRLSFFLTDFYNKKWLNRIPSKKFKFQLQKREALNNSIPHELVKTYPQLEIWRRLLTKFVTKAKASVIMDDMLAKQAVSYANKFKLNLLLYEFQAEYAFKQSYKHNPIKIVFYFHPHPSYEHSILVDDCNHYPAFQREAMENTRMNLSPYYQGHAKTAWKLADHIIVASSFTKKSLCHIGADPAKITIAPYGLTINNTFDVSNDNYDPYFLFVGSGSQRKGLHHLLYAWQKSNLSKVGKLIVVSRNVGTFNTKLLQQVPNVIWKNGVSQSELTTLYTHASLFIMPSLSEGFGHVYLEALNFGCPVLGTDHSVLADIKGYDDVIFKVQPGNVDELSSIMEKLWDRQPGLNPEIRKKAKEIPTRFTWKNFQESIESVLKKFD